MDQDLGYLNYQGLNGILLTTTKRTQAVLGLIEPNKEVMPSRNMPIQLQKNLGNWTRFLINYYYGSITYHGITSYLMDIPFGIPLDCTIKKARSEERRVGKECNIGTEPTNKTDKN